MGGRRISLFVLNLLSSLPEDAIGADRRTKYREDDCEIVASETDLREHKVFCNAQPRHADHEHCADIGEERRG
jgi:hypothetical protein